MISSDDDYHDNDHDDYDDNNRNDHDDYDDNNHDRTGIAKLCNNLSLGIQMIATSEAMQLVT